MPDVFWDLSWYELHLLLMSVERKYEIRKMAEESEWKRTSVIWSTIINMSGKTSKKSVRPDDLFKKGNEVELKLMTPEEVDKLIQEHGGE